MTILKDLLALRSGPVHNSHITEARREGDLADLIEKWMDQNRAYNMEGPSGERNFEKLIRVLGYRDMSEFLQDNSGALNAMVEWLGTMRNTEWVEALRAEVGGDEDEDDDDK